MHLFSLSHTGFGINTNILETNVLNLGVVIAFVVVNLGKSFSEAINTRRERILKAMARAEERYKQAQALVQEAKVKFAGVQYKALRLRSDGRVFLKRLNLVLLKEARQEERRLRKTEYEKRLLVEKKGVSFIQSRLLSLIFSKAPKKISKRFEDPSFQRVATLYWIKAFPTRVL